MEKLTDEEKQYYGLFTAVYAKHWEPSWKISRITLNYDMAFLIIFLPLYKAETIETKGALFTFKPRQFLYNEITDYAADMNIVLISQLS